MTDIKQIGFGMLLTPGTETVIFFPSKTETVHEQGKGLVQYEAPASSVQNKGIGLRSDSR